MNLNSKCQPLSVIPYFIRYAFYAAGGGGGNDRKGYWRYQSDDGKYFWAEEAYYFHLTLSQIIPFWHTVRINELLGNTPLHSYNFDDPFGRDQMKNQGWFLNPLHWLADISTPDGKMPPIDDGNKRSMYNLNLLRWTKDYGDEDIGKKFAWIDGTADMQPAGEVNAPSLYPVEIAIPRLEKPNHSQINEVVGNTFANRKSGDGGNNYAAIGPDYARQEVVVRRKIANRTHYILLRNLSRMLDRIGLSYYFIGI